MADAGIEAVVGETVGPVVAQAEASSPTEADATVLLPYARSWLDVVFDWLTGLPGPTWLAYLALIVPGVILSMSEAWLSDLTPIGQLDPRGVFWGTATVAILAASHYLRVVAGRAFDEFRPALGGALADQRQARYELTVMPAWPVLGLTLFSFAITPIYYVTDPVASQVVGVSAAGLVPRLISEGLTSTIVLAILFQAIRQMRRVNRLHAIAENVDPFRPAPLYAFSKLTSQVGIILIAFNAAGFLANPGATRSDAAIALYAPWLIGFTVGSIFVFVVPLLGMHRRLAAARDLQQAAAGGRLRGLLAELNEAIDARATQQVDALDRTIGALRRETEVIAKLPTWPWSLGTIRGFGSALLLPILLFLAQRWLGQLLG